MKYQKHSEHEIQIALELYRTRTLKEVVKTTGINQGIILYWTNKTPLPKIKIQAQTLSHQISKVKAYLFKTHKTLTLSTKQAFDAIGVFERGRDLGHELNTERLPTLSIHDVAKYITLYT